MDNLYNDYIDIWQCFNKSGKLKQMLHVVRNHLKNHDYEMDKHGNIFIGDFSKNRACLVAHLDSVHGEKSTQFYLKDNVLSSNNGIGGDDKCGIVTILEILKDNNNINAIFPIDEEIGGIGASEIQADKLENVLYFIEIDRNGNDDIIFNSGGNQLANEEFQNDLIPISDKHGYFENIGTFTDVNILTETSGICAINVSAGYYQAHTKGEFVNLIDLQRTINFVSEVIQTINKKYEWEGYYDTYFNEYYSRDEMQHDTGHQTETISVFRNDYENFEDLIEDAVYLGYDEDVIELMILAYKFGAKENTCIEV